MHQFRENYQNALNNSEVNKANNDYYSFDRLKKNPVNYNERGYSGYYNNNNLNLSRIPNNQAYNTKISYNEDSSSSINDNRSMYLTQYNNNNDGTGYYPYAYSNQKPKENSNFYSNTQSYSGDSITGAWQWS